MFSFKVKTCGVKWKMIPHYKLLSWYKTEKNKNHY